MPIIERRIHGYLVGEIWWPYGAECYKPLSYDLDRQNFAHDAKLTLREHVLRACNDGDFQFAKIADGYLEIARTTARGRYTVRRSKMFELTCFPSIADCIKTDWDGPMGDDE